MTEGTSGTAPGSTLRGAESGATLTEGSANPVGTFRTKRSPRFVMTSSHRTSVTAAGRWREAPFAITTSTQHEVSELSGAGQSSRRERSRREASGPTRRKSSRTRPLARDASVGRVPDTVTERKRFRKHAATREKSCDGGRPPSWCAGFGSSTVVLVERFGCRSRRAARGVSRSMK